MRRVGQPLGVFLASRVVVLGAVGVVLLLHPPLAAAHFTGPWPDVGVGEPAVLQALGVWDAGWYLQIAAHGYVTSLHPVTGISPEIAFFPLFPLAVRGVAAVTGLSALAAGVATALVCGAVAAVLIRAVVACLADEEVADRAVALWCFFPGAYVLSLAYSEGLAVACAAACLLALLRRRWVIAGVAAALATATAPDALVLVVCCAWASAAALRRDSARMRDWRSLVAPVLAPLGALGFWAFLWARTGDPLAWYRVEHLVWHGQIAPGAALSLVARGFTHPLALDLSVPALGAVVALVGGVLLWRWRVPVVVWLYAGGVLTLAVLSGPQGARPRFLLAAFPLVAALAWVARGPRFHALLGSSAVLLALLTIITTSTIALTP